MTRICRNWWQFCQGLEASSSISIDTIEPYACHGHPTLTTPLFALQDRANRRMGRHVGSLTQGSSGGSYRALSIGCRGGWAWNVPGGAVCGVEHPGPGSRDPTLTLAGETHLDSFRRRPSLGTGRPHDRSPVPIGTLSAVRRLLGLTSRCRPALTCPHDGFTPQPRPPLLPA